MKALKTILIIVVVAAGFFILHTGDSWAIPSSEALFTEFDLGGGLWRYDYTLYNTSDPVADAGYDVYDFFLNVAPSVTISNIIAPTDWDIISDNSSFIDWYSLVPGEPPAGADIAPATSLGGFGFTSDTQLASLSFDVVIVNPMGDPVIYGGTSAPVPEPATLFLIGTGIAGIACLRRRRVFQS